MGAFGQAFANSMFPGNFLGNFLPFKKGGRVRLPPRTKSGRFRKRK
jgi:hypothetical protein